MANKAILTVDVEDSAFKRFYDQYKAFSTDLDSMPQSWRAIGAAMGDATKEAATGALDAKEAFAVAAAQAAVIAEALRDAIKAQDGLGKSTGSTTKGMQGLAKSVGGVAKGIETVAGWILKLGAIGGLGALFSGFGFGELANSAFTRSRSAGRLGVSTGTLASFQANLQQFLDPSAIEAAANAQVSLGSAPLWGALGIDYQKALRMSPADLAIEELRKAAIAYKQNPAMYLQTPAGQAYQALGGNVGDVRQAAAHRAELNEAQARMHADQKALDIDEKAAQAMTDFKIALDKAGFTIDTVLINKLAALAPPLEKLALEFTNFIVGFIDGPEFNEIVKNVSSALKDFGDYLGSPQFLSDLREFEAIVGVIAQKLGWLVPKPKSAADIKLEKRLDDESAAHRKLVTDTFWNLIKGAGQFGSDFKKELTSSPFWQNVSWISHAISGGGRPKNNPLDQKILQNGVPVFAQYATTAEGIRANAKRLAEFAKVWDIKDTISAIIAKWDPEGIGASGKYASDVEKWSGVPKDLSMSKWSKAQFASVIAAMSREEGTDQVSIEEVIAALYGDEVKKAHQQQHRTTAPTAKRSRSTPKKVSVLITSTTGARVAVSTNALAAG